MYFPYIRTKQYDLDAILSVDPTIYASGKVMPIIEPVTKIKKNQYAKLAAFNIPFILIVNPIVGPLRSIVSNASIVSDLINDVFDEYDNFSVGFIIHPTTTIRQITQFIGAYPKHQHAFIHFAQFNDTVSLVDAIGGDDNKKYNIFIEDRVSLDYINELADCDTFDIQIKDGFRKQPKNESYPAQDFFYDLHKIYIELGYEGFGDFTIIGEDFSEGGGPAYVVALHLTDVDERGDLMVRHFKSDTTPPLTPVDPGGKFMHALNSLIRYLRTNPALTSTGITEYKNLNRAGHFPGLGVPKKLSIIHHIETVYNQI